MVIEFAQGLFSVSIIIFQGNKQKIIIPSLPFAGAGVGLNIYIASDAVNPLFTVYLCWFACRQKEQLIVDD